MKNLILILAAVLGLLAGVIFTPYFVGPLVNHLPSKADQPESSIVSPIRIEIPKINVNAQIEHVGLDKTGNMDVPKDVNNVAWYNLGPAPGVKGSSVMAGHLDSTTGPAVFFNLFDLEPGDEITIIDENNNRQIFTVEKKEIYADDAFPVNEVFAKDDKPRLNLVTCRGKFDRVARKYPERVVVYAVLGKCTSKIFNYCLSM